MSRRSPLVYVDRRAQEHARRIVSGCPEVEIAQAISASQIRFDGGTAVIRGDGWEATAVRTEGQIRPRPRAWTVVSIVARATPPRLEE